MMKTQSAKEEQGCLEFFGLHYNPFPVSPEEDKLYFSKHIEQILAEIIFGINARKGFMVLTGEVGLGKTTISRKIINILEEKGVETSLVFYTGFQDVELIREINRDFGQSSDSFLFSDQMKVLYDFLMERNRSGKNCVIIIDDAQNLDLKNLELIRMISNLETDREKLVQILLVGQPELMDMLNSHELRQLKSRIVIQKEAKALSQEELKDYLSFKLSLAGNRGQIRIQKTALKKIYKLTKGNFRKINLLMDRCLYVAFLHNTTEISKQIVMEAFIDFNTKKENKFKTYIALAASVFLVLSLFGSIVYSGFSRNNFPISAFSTSSHIQAKNISSLPKYNEIKDKDLDQSANAAVIPKSVIDFLEKYKLGKYQKPFFKALQTNQFGKLTQEIFNDSGYMMMRLNHAADIIKKKYGILKYISRVDNHQELYLFWRPPVVFNKFYYYYEGEEVLALQKKMAEMHLYTAGFDAKVGKNLMMAVVGFQKKMGLPVTGYPDSKTIFLLWNKVENITNDA